MVFSINKKLVKLFHPMRSFLFVCLTFFCPLVGDIVELSNMEAVRQRIGPMDCETLLVFDVDNTLTIPANPVFQMANVKEHRNLIRTLTKEWSNEEKTIAKNYMVLQESILLDNATGNWIYMLQNHHIPVMAFSNTLTYPLGSYFFPYFRKEQLLGFLNVDFMRSPPEKDSFVLDDYPARGGTHPLYQRGILHGNNEEKGPLFVHFLDQVTWKPKKVIFIDDDRECVDSMQKALNERGISFLGIHFTGAQSLRTASVSSDVMQQNWQTLIAAVSQIMREKSA